MPETQIHDLLRNERRQQVIKHMQRTVGSTTLRELAVAIAEQETGESPPPKNIRDSVYNSLHQTHLPKLDRRGVIEYDSDRKTVTLEEDAKSVRIYMEVVTDYGVTWDEVYRMLGTLSLFVVLAAHIDVPLVSAVDPVLWTSLFLFVFAVVMGYQLWSQRWIYLNALLS
ncbi:hypothetical protein AArcSl_2765 [Halalkaliarchaeum desulfuricum]|uniref:DUF7344 domain-containing protein n=1 Tax=Halalkaliarchaeum desulfuricum TaxID=2055893 RepID=A0A343TMQ8_9EURY|nr:hypothetical protein AArcSl_2765 [Halalkaliarchaeum desulfuricum]